MLKEALQDFRIGRPQIVAGLLLLIFMGECLWVAAGRRLSDLEYQYLSSSHAATPGQSSMVTSPLTGVVAGLPLKLLSLARRVAPAQSQSMLAIPHPWILRLPFVIFGAWLGGALWWVARRLFGNEGGYVALALYCFSPAMVQIGSNVGPEVILAWSGFGLIYTAIGVAHTVYSPPRKWLPRIVILGLALGACISTLLWGFTLVVLAFAFMVYLTPGKRNAVLIVLSGASAIGLSVLAFFGWLTGSIGLGSLDLITPHVTRALAEGLLFMFADGRVFPFLFAGALATYLGWPRARYFGNTSPLITGFISVLLFALVPATYIWQATLGLSFAFVFVGGVAADVLETPARRPSAWILAGSLLLKAVFSLIFLNGWIVQNPV